MTARTVFRVSAGAPVHALDRVDDTLLPDRLVPDVEGRMLYTSGSEIHREGRRIYSLPAEGAGPPAGQMMITAMVLDHEGSLWLGTRAAGLHRLKPSLFRVYSEAEGLSHRNVFSVYEDRSGRVWIGTLVSGTNRLTARGITRLRSEDGFPATASSFLEDRAGRLWVGGDGTRVCAPPATRCAPHPSDPEPGAMVRAIYEETSGALWFGTASGLQRYEGGIWTRFTEADGAPAFPVRVFRQTGDGALWMGTNGGGLARYHEGRFTRVTTADALPGDLVRSLYEDADGWLWVGTEGRGLARLDPREWREGRRGGRIVRYRLSDGLFDEVIHQVLEDDFGRLWMSSNRGIFWVERAELLEFAAGRIARINSTGYTERDGLRNREANGGSQGAGMKSRDGRLWFATQDGVAVVDPSRIQRNRFPPNVVIERVIAGGTPLRPGGTLGLGVDQRDLEIEYTALSLLAPGNVRFRYRLEPYDREWVEAGGRRTAYYTHVPPGRYTFRVIASNNDGVWNEEGAALVLRLASRFHETRAFRLLALLGMGLLVAGGVGWRLRSQRRRTRELARLVDERTRALRERERQLQEKTEQLQELDRAKSHFFANVSHEFRTPLTLILGPLRDLAEEREGPLPGRLRGQMEMMTRNAQRLLRLVNQVLDLARLESRTLALHREPRDLVELAHAITRSFTPLAERREIALAFHARAERLPVEVDGEQMDKVLLNLLSNAFKFTDPGGAVEVTLREEEGRAVMAVRDTGIGIAPAKLPRVFERFYQADGSATRRHEGTGIGLSLVQELVELHGGTVSAESEPGVGSTFTVRVPLSPHPHTLPVEEQGSGGAEEPFPLGPSAPPPRRGEDEPGGAEDRTTVLVVDDHADIRAYVRTVLEPGYRVLEAADGQEGLERARAALPDLVVADVMMPRLDGFGLARALREDPATDCIPVILLTARAEPGHEVEGLGTGVDDYITKPFHAGVLEARVGNLIASRRRLRERFRQEGLPAPAAQSLPAPQRSDLEARLRALVEANLSDPDFNPEALATAAGLSYQRLHRRISRELEVTPSHFIRTVRVERAALLLREGAGSVTEVAYSVGFNSLSYFHRCFQERFGTAPSATTKLPA
jgi:signal transduction histidine kinase/DNA-binding response OmpR family regulator/streptogramin lyase